MKRIVKIQTIISIYFLVIGLSWILIPPYLDKVCGVEIADRFYHATNMLLVSSSLYHVGIKIKALKLSLKVVKFIMIYLASWVLVCSLIVFYSFADISISIAFDSHSYAKILFSGVFTTIVYLLVLEWRGARR